jgi:hypothetical protein
VTRKLNRYYSLIVVAAPVAILVLLIVASVRAQMPGAHDASGRTSHATGFPPADASSGSLAHTVASASRASVRQRATSHRDTSQDHPLFLWPVAYQVSGEQADAVAVADLNNDGKNDLVVSVGFASATGLAVLLGNGDGTFLPAVKYSAGAFGLGPVVIADVNGDGKLDIVVANECIASESRCGTPQAANGRVGVLLGNGDGTFQPVVLYDSGGQSTESIAVADVNGDGKSDVVTTNWDSRNNGNNRLSVLLGNGDGTFQPAQNYSSGGCGFETFGVAIADVNADHKPDLLVAIGGGDDSACGDGQVTVLLGNGDGTFQTPVAYDAGDRLTIWVTVADVNGDGKLDLLAANFCDALSCTQGSVGVLLGNGDGSFQPVVTYPSGGYAAGMIAAADVNHDGKLDMAVANACQGRCANGNGAVGVLLGNGDGSFQAVQSFDPGPGANGIAAVDVNGNGGPDLLVGNASGTVDVLLNNNLPDTTTTLSSSPNPSVFGQTVLLTAQVSAASGVPTGPVLFTDNTTTLGTVALSGGSALLSITSLVVGSHSITAAYEGSLTLSESTSAPLTQIVNLATTTTTLTSSQNPQLPYQYVRYYATVANQYGEGTRGTVTFQDNGVTIAVVNLLYNQAAYAASYKTIGIHSITAIYSGDSNNGPSKSATLNEDVVGASQTKLTTSASPTLVGQPVTFTTTVTSQYGAIPNGELVTFYDWKTILASTPLAGGTASYTTSSLSAKTHTIKASYSGDASFKPSTAMVSQVVNKYSSTTALSSSLNPSAFGKAVTFTAVVSSIGPYPPTGKVRFWDGTLGIGFATLSSGVATVTKPKLAVGAHPITAQYLGDAASVKSTSPVLDQVVQ